MYYFVYVKLNGEKRFSLSNPHTLAYGVGKVFAPRFTEENLKQLKDWIDKANEIPEAIWQIRTVNGKIIYPERAC